MKVRPFHDRLLVKRVTSEEKTAGRHHHPRLRQGEAHRGRGPVRGQGQDPGDGKVVPLEVKKGDRVLFGKYSGTEIKIEGEEHLILREDDVLGIIEK